MGPTVGDFLDIRVVQLGSHVLILVQLGSIIPTGYFNTMILVGSGSRILINWLVK